MKRLVDLDEIPVINQYIGNQNFVRLPDLEACPEAPDCEKCRRMLWDRLFTTDEQIVINRLMIDSLPTPVTKLLPNQAYEEWLDATALILWEYYLSPEQISLEVLTKIITEQANFIWQKLCDKNDQIIKLETKLANATRILLQMKGETDV